MLPYSVYFQFNGIDMTSIRKGLVPDFILRRIVRSLCRQRLREIDRGSMEANQETKMQWIEELRGRELIAEAVDKANEQHYEVRF